MVIHFTASRLNVANDFVALKKIITAIHKSGSVLARDWMEPQYHIEITKSAKELDPQTIYQLNMDAIERAELVIIENSEKSFGNGFQAAIALSKKKPTLILVRKDRRDAESKMAQGVKDPLLMRKEYGGATELGDIITEFIKDNTVNAKDLRFNFVIDRQLYNHIRWKSFRAKKTKAEVVRELLLRDMEGRD